MRIETIKKKTIEYLEKTYMRDGPFPKLLWNSKRSMIGRYNAITSMVDFKDKELLDVGCGFCDFYDYLLKHGVKLKSYRGIDLHLEVVREARARHPSLDIEWGDILAKKIEEDSFDYCVGCGIVTFAIDCWKARTTKIMKEMFRIARLGVVIDFLKDRKEGPPKDPKSYYCKMSEALKIAEKIAPYVNLKNDYRFNSFCLTLLKYEN